MSEPIFVLPNYHFWNWNDARMNKRKGKIEQNLLLYYMQNNDLNGMSVYWRCDLVSVYTIRTQSCNLMQLKLASRAHWEFRKKNIVQSLQTRFNHNIKKANKKNNNKRKKWAILCSGHRPTDNKTDPFEIYAVFRAKRLKKTLLKSGDNSVNSYSFNPNYRQFHNMKGIFYL